MNLFSKEKMFNRAFKKEKLDLKHLKKLYQTIPTSATVRCSALLLRSEEQLLQISALYSPQNRLLRSGQLVLDNSPLYVHCSARNNSAADQPQRQHHNPSVGNKRRLCRCRA
jgi:hypothetical protein